MRKLVKLQWLVSIRVPTHRNYEVPEGVFA
jgi:hypothetical protein